MNDVAETLHLQKRGGVWYYFRCVPKTLVAAIGKQFIKRSLGTSSLTEAKRLRTIHDLNSDALFMAAEKEGIGSGKGSKHSVLPLATLTEHVRSMIAIMDRQSAERLLKDPPADRTSLKERQADTEYELGILTNPADLRQHELIGRAGQRLLDQIGADIPDLSEAAQFEEIIRRGLIELCRRRLDRYADRYDRSYYDGLFDPARPASMTLEELSQTYLAEKEEDYQLNGVSPKRLDKIKASVAVLCEMIDGQMPVHAIDDDVVQRVRSLLAQMPSNRTKLYPGLPLDAAIERAKKDGKPGLSSSTQAHYLEILRDMLKVAVRKKYLPSNPAEEVKPLKKDGVTAAEKRRPWTDQQLREFFMGSSFYRSCAPGFAKPYTGKDRDWRFWLPLLMLFSGARPNEICQLHVDDIARTPIGVWYMSLTDEKDGNSLKTQASRRRVPIHPELIRIGFLQFVDRQKQQGASARLFPALKPNKYGNLAWYPVKRFNEQFLPATMVLQERQSLYSLRHNVRDALRRAKAPAETLLAVTGWSPSGKAVSDNYGDPGNPDHHAEYVEKISYAGLDLSFLYAPAPEV
ncbi:MAG: site-specific integrase [Sphingomonadales bacterium]|nr:MAG: site-specific integrase [Sphingomonadales bacterium]